MISMFKNTMPILRKTACYKRGMYLILCITISSCTLSKNYSTQPKISNRSESKEIVYAYIAGNKFMVDKAYHIEVEKCINENDSVQKYFITYQDSINEIKEYALSNLPSIRKIIQRGNFAYLQRLLKTQFNIQTQLCVNNLGIVTMSRIIKSDIVLQEQERERFLAFILDYKFTSDSSAYCLQCGSLTISANPVKK